MSCEIGIEDVLAALNGSLHKLDLVELSEVYAMVRARAAYRDDGYPERRCDRCGAPYRGPAVYCCLRHAQLDAP